VLGVEPVIADPLLEERSADFELRELIDVVQPHVEWAQTVSRIDRGTFPRCTAASPERSR